MRSHCRIIQDESEYWIDACARYRDDVLGDYELNCGRIATRSVCNWGDWIVTYAYYFLSYIGRPYFVKIRKCFEREIHKVNCSVILSLLRRSDFGLVAVLSLIILYHFHTIILLIAQVSADNSGRHFDDVPAGITVQSYYLTCTFHNSHINEVMIVNFIYASFFKSN